MNLTELDNFRLTDAINFHTELNPQLFVGEEMRPPVRAALMKIAQDFIEFIGLLDIALVDITVSGSNAAYSYTPHSDIDLHLIVDFGQLADDEVYQELFDAKKYQYNDQHDIKVKGYDVEVYVQAADQPHSSLGEYSINRNDWNRIPTKKRANLDDIATKLKYEKLRQLALQALAGDDQTYLNNVLDTIKRYRSAGLADGGEFGPENLAFKVLRKQGFFERLWAKRREHEDRELSLEGQDTVLEEVKREFNSIERIDETVKRMYKRDTSIFDRYSFEAVYEVARKLIQEDGRIVKGVNTTCDVGVDQIKIEAGKMGFDVTRDGRPPLLRESMEMLDEEELTELNMSPGGLRRQIDELQVNPIVGVEMEMCWPRDDIETEPAPEVTRHTDWDDILDFFEHNVEDDFRSMRADHEEWVYEQEGEWTEQQVQEALDVPGMDTEVKRDFLVDEYTLTSEQDDLLAAMGGDIEEGFTVEAFKKMINDADDAFQKFGPVQNWDPQAMGKVKPGAVLYHSIVTKDPQDELEEHLREHYQSEFYNTELTWDDENYTVGAWLKQRNYEDMEDIFNDYSDVLHAPDGLGGVGGAQPYDDDLAHRIAGDLLDVGIEAEATGEYHSGAGSRTEWHIEEDTSIEPHGDDAGFEVISPPMVYKQAISEIEAVVDYAQENNAYTNQSCGLHVNVSLEGVDFEKCDFIKLILLIGDQYVLKKYNRLFNQYAMSSSKALGQFMTQMAEKPTTAKRYLNFLAQMRNKVDDSVANNLSGELQLSKHVSVNIENGYAEFRAAGGDYLGDFDGILNTINRVVVAYAAACDPNAHKNEYAKKLYKLASSSNKADTDDYVNQSLKLFALFSAGVYTKDELVNQIKKLQQTRQKKAVGSEAPEFDVGSPEMEQAVTSMMYELNRTHRNSNESPAWHHDQLIKGAKAEFPSRKSTKDALNTAFEKLKANKDAYANLN